MLLLLKETTFLGNNDLDSNEAELNTFQSRILRAVRKTVVQEVFLPARIPLGAPGSSRVVR